MPQRSEPQILADLVRLLTRLEGQSFVQMTDDELALRQKKQTADDAELIEQADFDWEIAEVIGGPPMIFVGRYRGDDPE